MACGSPSWFSCHPEPSCAILRAFQSRTLPLVAGVRRLDTGGLNRVGQGAQGGDLIERQPRPAFYGTCQNDKLTDSLSSSGRGHQQRHRRPRRRRPGCAAILVAILHRTPRAYLWLWSLLNWKPFQLRLIPAVLMNTCLPPCAACNLRTPAALAKWFPRGYPIPIGRTMRTYRRPS
jgi:hypothetical protein